MNPNSTLIASELNLVPCEGGGGEINSRCSAIVCEIWKMYGRARGMRVFRETWLFPLGYSRRHVEEKTPSHDISSCVNDLPRAGKAIIVN
jgi:hypothetical protein